jgi:hypothetical protein
MNRSFTIYTKHLYYNIGDIIEISLDKCYEKNINFSMKIKNSILFGVIGDIRNNGSVEGTLLNGGVELGPPTLKTMGEPYTSPKGDTCFMWSKNKKSDIDIKLLYPELLLVV